MQSICLADGEGVSQGFRSQFSIPEGSLGARKGPRKKFCNSEVAPKMATSSNPCISTVSRGHLEKVLKIKNGHPKIFTAYLRCPVTTSKSAQKYFSSLLPKV